MFLHVGVLYQAQNKAGDMQLLEPGDEVLCKVLAVVLQ